MTRKIYVCIRCFQLPVCCLALIDLGGRAVRSPAPRRCPTWAKTLRRRNARVAKPRLSRSSGHGRPTTRSRAW